MDKDYQPLVIDGTHITDSTLLAIAEVAQDQGKEPRTFNSGTMNLADLQNALNNGTIVSLQEDGTVQLTADVEKSLNIESANISDVPETIIDNRTSDLAGAESSTILEEQARSSELEPDRQSREQYAYAVKANEIKNAEYYLEENLDKTFENLLPEFVGFTKSYDVEGKQNVMEVHEQLESNVNTLVNDENVGNKMDAHTALEQNVEDFVFHTTRDKKITESEYEILQNVKELATQAGIRTDDIAYGLDDALDMPVTKDPDVKDFDTGRSR